jgi:hypothetical protein
MYDKYYDYDTTSSYIIVPSSSYDSTLLAIRITFTYTYSYSYNCIIVLLYFKENTYLLSRTIKFKSKKHHYIYVLYYIYIYFILYLAYHTPLYFFIITAIIVLYFLVHKTHKGNGHNNHTSQHTVTNYAVLRVIAMSCRYQLVRYR